jgi:AsmA protein
VVTVPANFKLAPRVMLKAWNLLPGGIQIPATLTGTALVTGDAGKVTFADLDLQVDGDPLTGEIVLTGARQEARKADRPAETAEAHWVLRLSSSRLNLDTFFPPATPEERAQPPSTTPWKMSFLNKLSLDARLTAKAAKLHGLNLSASTAAAALQRGRFSLQVETADFYGGVSTILVQGSFVPERSQVYISRLLSEMRGIALGRAIQDNTGADAYGGTADIRIDLSGAMRSNADLYAGLSGIWSLKISDGVYPAFLGSETAGLRNTFSQASVSGVMDKGVLRADNFVLSGMMVDMSGDGWVDLGRRTLDAHLNVTIAKVPTVPVRFYGSLDSPSMYLRGAHMVLDTAQAAGGTVFSLLRGILELPAMALTGLVSREESGKKK